MTKDTTKLPYVAKDMILYQSTRLCSAVQVQNFDGETSLTGHLEDRMGDGRITWGWKVDGTGSHDSAQWQASFVSSVLKLWVLLP